MCSRVNNCWNNSWILLIMLLYFAQDDSTPLQKCNPREDKRNLVEVESPSVWELREPLVPLRSTLVPTPSTTTVTMTTTTTCDLMSTRPWYQEMGSDSGLKPSLMSNEKEHSRGTIQDRSRSPMTVSLITTTSSTVTAPTVIARTEGNTDGCNSLDVSMSHLSMGHPAPPPPPKRSPQTVLTG